MAQFGIDYSWARPGGKAIREHGYLFACRYLSYDTTGKNISRAEATDLLSHGVGIVLVWEQAAADALKGHARGVSDAREALKQARALGFPEDRPIYFAVDFDAADTDVQNNAIYGYFQGVIEVIGLARTGIYAGYYPLKRVHERGLAKWLWQTVAWSGGRIYEHIHLYQNGEVVFGDGADINVIYQKDVGAWAAGTAVVTPVVPASGDTYTVVSGDTLSGIGTKTGVDWRTIAQLNNLSAPYVIYPNQVLKLKGGAAPASSGTTYTVVAGDTLSGIAARFGIDWRSLQVANNIADPNRIYVGQVLTITGAAPSRTYTVVAGDYLAKIGTKTGVDWRTIASHNGIGSPYTIYPGQVLRLP